VCRSARHYIKTYTKTYIETCGTPKRCAESPAASTQFAFSNRRTNTMPPTPDLIALARTAASDHTLDATLVCAVIEQESAWDAHAIRYEPGFRTRYVAPLGLPPTEGIARSISWGLMQVMGQVAREHGFTGKFLSALCDPVAGLAIGCAVLAAKIASAANDPARALQLWNGGANPNYAAEVLARVVNYK
jgi:soluble lytic murein transglycosylase-like protein